MHKREILEGKKITVHAIQVLQTTNTIKYTSLKILKGRVIFLGGFCFPVL